MKKIIALFSLLIGFQHLSALETGHGLVCAAGVSADLYTDFSTVMTINEGVLFQCSFTALETKKDGFCRFEIQPGLKTGVLFEGANSMKRIFLPAVFPLYIPLCPVIKVNASLGRKWNLHVYSSLGPYLTLYNDFAPVLRFHLEGGLGVSWYAFERSGFEIDVKYGLFGRGDYWRGFGLSLWYVWKPTLP